MTFWCRANARTRSEWLKYYYHRMTLCCTRQIYFRKERRYQLWQSQFVCVCVSYIIIIIRIYIQRKRQMHRIRNVFDNHFYVNIPVNKVKRSDFGSESQFKISRRFSGTGQWISMLFCIENGTQRAHATAPQMSLHRLKFLFKFNGSSKSFGSVSILDVPPFLIIIFMPYFFSFSPYSITTRFGYFYHLVAIYAQTTVDFICTRSHSKRLLCSLTTENVISCHRVTITGTHAHRTHTAKLCNWWCCFVSVHRRQYTSSCG